MAAQVRTQRAKTAAKPINRRSATSKRCSSLMPKGATPAQRQFLKSFRASSGVAAILDDKTIFEPYGALAGSSGKWDRNGNMIRFIRSNFPCVPEVDAFRNTLSYARRSAAAEASELIGKLPVGSKRTRVESLLPEADEDSSVGDGSPWTTGWCWGFSAGELLTALQSLTRGALTGAECTRLRDAIWNLRDYSIYDVMPIKMYDLDLPLTAHA